MAHLWVLLGSNYVTRTFLFVAMAAIPAATIMAAVANPSTPDCCCFEWDGTAYVAAADEAPLPLLLPPLVPPDDDDDDDDELEPPLLELEPPSSAREESREKKYSVILIGVNKIVVCLTFCC
jgi:hypothetical protein